MNGQKLRILTLVKSENQQLWKELEEGWSKHFVVEHIVDTPNNIKKYLKKRVDILFTDNPEVVEEIHYKNFIEHSHTFAFVGLKNKPAIEDTKWLINNFVDRIIYTGISNDYTTWAIHSVLRRYWSNYTNPSKIEYKNIQADFVESKFFVNDKEVNLTSKEIDLLRYFLEQREIFIPKKKIFRDVWGFEEMDTTRTVDQMIFKLKNKIGQEHFLIVRNKGVKFG